MRITVEHIMLGIWYGAFILGGITVGLFLHPYIASADTEESFDALSVGDIATTSTGWLEYPNAPTYKLPNITAVASVSSPNSLLFDRGIESGNVGLMRILGEYQSSFSLSLKWKTIANSAGNYGTSIIFAYYPLGEGSGVTRAVCSYASTTALVEIRVSLDTTTTCKGSYKVVGIFTENTWVDVTINTDDTTDIITVTADDGLGAQSATSSKTATYDYVPNFKMLQSLTNTDDYFDDFGWSTGGTGGTGSATLSFTVDMYNEDSNGDRDTTTDLDDYCFVDAPHTEYCAQASTPYEAFSVEMNGELAEGYYLSLEILDPVNNTIIQNGTSYSEAIYPANFPYTITDTSAFYFPGYQVLATSTVKIRMCQNLNGTIAYFGYQSAGDCATAIIGNGMSTSTTQSIAESVYTNLAGNTVTAYEACQASSTNMFLDGIKCGFVWLFYPEGINSKWWATLQLESHAPFAYMYDMVSVVNSWANGTTTQELQVDVDIDMGSGTSTVTVFDVDWVTSIPLWDWVYELMALGMYLMAGMYVYRAIMQNV